MVVTDHLAHKAKTIWPFIEKTLLTLFQVKRGDQEKQSPHVSSDALKQQTAPDEPCHLA